MRTVTNISTPYSHSIRVLTLGSTLLFKKVYKHIGIIKPIDFLVKPLFLSFVTSISIGENINLFKCLLNQYVILVHETRCFSMLTMPKYFH